MWTHQISIWFPNSPIFFFIDKHSKPRSCKLKGKLVPDDLSTLHLHLLVKPLPVTATLDATFAGTAIRAGVEAAHAVHIQTVTRVLAIGN